MHLGGSVSFEALCFLPPGLTCTVRGSGSITQVPGRTLTSPGSSAVSGRPWSRAVRVRPQFAHTITGIPGHYVKVLRTPAHFSGSGGQATAVPCSCGGMLPSCATQLGWLSSQRWRTISRARK
jgi:hypothetical protein